MSNHAVTEDGNDTGFSVGVLSGSIDICVSKDGVIETMFTACSFEVFLDSEFAARIGAEGNRGSVDSCASTFGDFAIDGPAGTGEDEVFDTVFGATLEDIEGAEDVDGSIPLGFPNTYGDAGLGSLVADKIGLKGGKDLLKCIEIADIDLMKVSSGWNILLVAAAEVIDDCNLPTVGKALFSEVTADKSGSASDKQTHKYFQGYGG
jgi:hypothetical protein